MANCPVHFPLKQFIDFYWQGPQATVETCGTLSASWVPDVDGGGFGDAIPAIMWSYLHTTYLSSWSMDVMDIMG